uniref:Platelet-derived growth factor (PDGF) family profile domain-containing protein n=1 Tax=Clastoptera arizonana TaxID=38151 RepID=A0A1B6C2A8_9HEMI
MIFKLCIFVLMWYISLGEYYFDDSYDDNNLANENEIPLDLLLRLSTINNMSKLMEMVIDSDEHDLKMLNNDYPEVASDFAEKNRKKRKDEILQPKPAGCIPTPQVVNLNLTNDLLSVYYPSCVIMQRCGGCCVKDFLACRPLKKKSVSYQILQIKYVKKLLTINKKIIITVDEHVKCACGCRILKSVSKL